MKVWKITGDCVPASLAFIAISDDEKYGLLAQLDDYLLDSDTPLVYRVGFTFTVEIVEMTEDEYESLVRDW